MGSFGDKLRREREMRGISLDEIASATKIGTRSLKALEDENFSILPGGIFNKGFVRAYAKFLGLNEEEAVTDYQAAVQEAPVSVKTIATQSAIAKANRLAAQQARESSHAAGILRAVLLLAVSVGIAVGGFTAYRAGYFKVFKMPSLHRQMKQQAQVAATATAPAAQTTTVTTQPSVPGATTQTGTSGGTSAPAEPEKPPESPVATIPAEFTVSIRATEASWMSITMDGKHPFQKTFAPNEQQDFTAKNRVRIVIGNPNGTELSLNGKPLPIGGDLSHPRTVVVDSSGFATE